MKIMGFNDVKSSGFLINLLLNNMIYEVFNNNQY